MSRTTGVPRRTYSLADAKGLARDYWLMSEQSDDPGQQLGWMNRAVEMEREVERLEKLAGLRKPPARAKETVAQVIAAARLQAAG